MPPKKQRDPQVPMAPIPPAMLEIPTEIPEPYLPTPRSSWRVQGSQVDEITWTREDYILRISKWNKDPLATISCRLWLRTAARRGQLTSRRNAVHGFWEYGTAWRSREFQELFNAAHHAYLVSVAASEHVR